MGGNVKSASRGPKPSRGTGWWFSAHVAVWVLVALAAWGYRTAKSDTKPTDLDYSRTHRSESGLYSLTYEPLIEPIPLNKIHSWRLHVEDADGRPVEGARVEVNGGMPEHGHGLPTKPRVTKSLGNGDYLVEGMKFQMHGWWVVHFSVTFAGGTDKVTFNLQL